MKEIYSAAHVLYRMFDRQKKLLYVGITAHPPLRFRSHSETKEWWGRVGNIELQSFDTREDLLAAEQRAIVDEKPEFNVVHSTRPRPVGPVSGVRVATYALSELVNAGLAPSELWLQRRLRKGLIKGRKVGRSWRLTEADIDALVEFLGNDHQEPPKQLVIAPPIGGNGLTVTSMRRRQATS